MEERPDREEGGKREEGDEGTAHHPPLPAARGEGKGERDDKLAEERLKWQMEMENLRRESEQREEVERERCAGEVKRCEERVGVLEERCRVMVREVEKGRRALNELNQARQRLVILTVNVSVTHRDELTRHPVVIESVWCLDLKHLWKMSSFQGLSVEVFYAYVLCGTTERYLIMYVFRLGELESELSGARERVIQLQGEKEKALADLNNIRKINRTIEKSVHTYTCTYIHVHVLLRH